MASLGKKKGNQPLIIDQEKLWREKNKWKSVSQMDYYWRSSHAEWFLFTIWEYKHLLEND